ncbi:hypothetical protein N474_01830 [Pseudoalteromonas luteoviolacea CPMOR-2]|uniref:hypothetical protein n=1 Tax=Pseudoalteromonas luteoviolacea TaxID=43657 RepID=UPI0007B09AAB|nr:hypothetical protein [Pseudoalteromonas luteoviolacea]KZN54483.1 hypothetical protein N474_01830 [Pseudoalteromonas luteoviolacea CPMOR-2]
MARIIALLALLMCSNLVLAGAQTGKIKDIRVRDDGLHWFVLDGASTNKPTCAKFGYWMIKDEKSDYGKSQFSMLLSAYMADKTITVVGANTCTRWTDGEDVGYLMLAK